MNLDLFLKNVLAALPGGIKSHTQIEWHANTDKSCSLNATYYNYVYVDKAATSMLIKYYPRTGSVAFSASAKSILDSQGVTYSVKKDGMLSVPEDVFGDSIDYSVFCDLIYASYSFDAFGCCGKYKECSQAGKCIHDDLVYATACMYRKNLEHGKRFY